MALMFLTGNGMSGGPLHHHISGAPLIGERRTARALPALLGRGTSTRRCTRSARAASRYWASCMTCRWTGSGTCSRNEPPELELSMVELSMVELDVQVAGARSAPQLSFGMVLRRGESGYRISRTTGAGWLTAGVLQLKIGR